jgi:hypothetical protein
MLKTQLLMLLLQSTGQKQRKYNLSLPENASAIAGSIVSIPVLLTSNTGKQISSFSFAVRFDPTLLQPDDLAIETTDSLSGNGFTIVSDTNTAGRIGIAASNLSGAITNSGTLLYLRFRVLEPANGSNYRAATALMFEKTKKAVRVSFEDNLGEKLLSSETNGLFSVAASNRFSGAVGFR